MSSPLASRLSPAAPSRKADQRPEHKLSTSAEARHRILQNLKPRIALHDSCVPQLVAARAAAQPDAPALVAGKEMITYGKLNDRTNQLANYLHALGCNQDSATDSDTLVGICLDRSSAGTICALGVLKAGAAYLSLDPAYPIERLTFIE